MSAKCTPVPPWATRALTSLLKSKITDFNPVKTVWNPCANMGYMSAALSETFPVVISTDPDDFGYGHARLNFFNDEFPLSIGPHWIIMAPPRSRMKKGEIGSIDDYVSKALGAAEYGVAIFATSDFLHGPTRYDRIFRENPPIIHAPFVEAIALSENSIDGKDAHKRNYAWYIWLKGVRQATRTFHIPPSKEALSRDYDAELPSLMPAINLDKTDG